MTGIFKYFTYLKHFSDYEQLYFQYILVSMLDFKKFSANC